MTAPTTEDLVAKYGEPDDCAEGGDLDNNTRADLAAGPYRHYVSACTSYGDDDLFKPEVLNEQVGDMIAALLHLVTRNGGDPESAHSSGWNHFTSEVGLGYMETPHTIARKDRDNTTKPPARPLVLVIEQPDEDPDVLSWGDVDVWYDSRYPSTRYASEERMDGGYDDYAVESRRLADDAEQRGADRIAAALRSLADEFDAAVANDPKSVPEERR